MPLERARALLDDQVAVGSGYNRNAARLILAEVEREHGQNSVDKLITELQLDTVFGLQPGIRSLIANQHYYSNQGICWP